MVKNKNSFDFKFQLSFLNLCPLRLKFDLNHFKLVTKPWVVLFCWRLTPELNPNTLDAAEPKPEPSQINTVLTPCPLLNTVMGQ